MSDLKTYRQRHKLSRAELAKMLGVTRITIFRWEEGSRKIGIPALPKVSKLTGIPIKRLRPDIFEVAQ